jgi:hypothetical protein
MWLAAVGNHSQPKSVTRRLKAAGVPKKVLLPMCVATAQLVMFWSQAAYTAFHKISAKRAKASGPKHRKTKSQVKRAAGDPAALDKQLAGHRWDLKAKRSKQKKQKVAHGGLQRPTVPKTAKRGRPRKPVFQAKPAKDGNLLEWLSSGQLGMRAKRTHQLESQGNDSPSGTHDIGGAEAPEKDSGEKKRGLGTIGSGDLDTPRNVGHNSDESRRVRARTSSEVKRVKKHRMNLERRNHADSPLCEMGDVDSEAGSHPSCGSSRDDMETTTEAQSPLTRGGRRAAATERPVSLTRTTDGADVCPCGRNAHRCVLRRQLAAARGKGKERLPDDLRMSPCPLHGVDVT